MKYLMITLFVVCCIFGLALTGGMIMGNYDEPSNTPRFVMTCKKVADILKAQYSVSGTNNNPECLIGKSDHKGQLTGVNFSTQDQLDGAEKLIYIQKNLPLHDKLQACNKKCEPYYGSSNSQYLNCWRPCAKDVGYYEGF